MYNFLFWITAQLFLLWMLDGLTRNYRNGKVFKILFLPSLLIEGLARMGACFLAAKPVEKIEFLEDKKPFLSDGKSRIAYFGMAIFLIIWQTAMFLGFYLWVTSIQGLNAYAMTLPHVEADAIAQGFVQFDARSYIYELKTFFQYTPWSSIELWLLLYLTCGVFPYAAMSGDHLKGGLVIVFFLGLFTTAVNYLGIRPGFLSRGWYLSRWVLPEFFSVYSLYLTLLCMTILMHFAVKIACRSIQAWIVRAAAPKEKSAKAKPRSKQPA